MESEAGKQFDSILAMLADELEVPAGEQEKARKEYSDLANWIKRRSDIENVTDSELYPQGSIRLGTLVRPVTETDEFDIDLVYCRFLTKTGTTQNELMESVGKQLRKYVDDYRGNSNGTPRLSRGRRCWRIQFEGFHLDVLPSIPDSETTFEVGELTYDQILITDRELRNWQHSNPRGYSAWFDSRQEHILGVERERMAVRAETTVENIPADSVKTPLRQAIKLLKRHRDVRYFGNPDDKPISIIITTLAARAYSEQTSVDEALNAIVSGMPTYIEDRNGVKWVANPTNPKENFADKWTEHPERAVRFYEWLSSVAEDVGSAREQRGLENVGRRLSRTFGSSVVERTMKRYGEDVYRTRLDGGLYMASATGHIGKTGDVHVKRHTNFGDKS